MIAALVGPSKVEKGAGDTVQFAAIRG
jgi:hypothetical protein